MEPARSDAPGGALPKAFVAYLRIIDEGLSEAPPSQRDAVLADMRSQIDDNLSRLDHPVGWSEGEAILARLGTPAEVLARHGYAAPRGVSKPGWRVSLLLAVGVCGLILVPLVPQIAALVAVVVAALGLRGALRRGPDQVWSVLVVVLGVVGLFCCAALGSWLFTGQQMEPSPEEVKPQEIEPSPEEITGLGVVVVGQPAAPVRPV